MKMEMKALQIICTEVDMVTFYKVENSVMAGVSESMESCVTVVSKGSGESRDWTTAWLGWQGVKVQGCVRSTCGALGQLSFLQGPSLESWILDEVGKIR